MIKPIKQLVRRLWKKGYKNIVGLDEVGRGALAGPVIAVAVMIDVRMFTNNKLLDIRNIKDSKKLSPTQREKLYKLITENSMIEWGIGRVSEKVIDKINILEATKLAMRRAVENLEKKFQKTLSYQNHNENNVKVEFLILDGKIKIDLPIPQESIVKADEKILSCTLASIIAKIKRDAIMKKYHQKYPQYGFNEHKGYLTKFHQTMLKKYGPCQIHRLSFKPLKDYPYK